MKLYILILSIISSVLSPVLAQKNQRIAELMKQPQEKLAKAPPEIFAFPFISLPMEFQNAKLEKASTEIIPDDPERVEAIVLFYTAYKESESFDQPELNKKRLEEFARYYPKILESKDIKWKFVAQTGAKNEDNAKKYFHGFVISFKPKNVKEPPPISDTEFIGLLTKSELTKDTILGVEKKEKCKKVRTGRYLPRNKSKRDAGITYATKSIWGRKAERILKCDTITKNIIGKVSHVDKDDKVWTFRDSTVETLLNRNSNWREMLVVCDATGSMSPYYSSLILWIKLQTDSSKVLGYSFFNDGNNKSDSEKKIGKTGGIYTSKGGDTENAVRKLLNCATNGGGGDIEENNLEATIEGIKAYPNCKDIIMIADGMAPVRDIELLSKINKPIRIIICSPIERFHPHYIEIAQKTGGSIHTLENDLDLSIIEQEGKTFTLGSVIYKVEKGKITPIKYL
ncbi:MAG: hypothetical protein ACK5CY_01145 [Bacteroidia bacterium]